MYSVVQILKLRLWSLGHDCFFDTLFGMHHMEKNVFVSEPIQQLCFHHLMFSLSYYQTSLLNFAAVTYILLWGRNF